MSLKSIKIGNELDVCELIYLVGTYSLNINVLNGMLIVLFVTSDAGNTLTCESNLGTRSKLIYT